MPQKPDSDHQSRQANWVQQYQSNQAEKKNVGVEHQQLLVQYIVANGNKPIKR